MPGSLEVTNNLAGEYAHRACCILGVRGSLIREQRPAAAVTEALLEALDWVAADPDAAAEIFAYAIGAAGVNRAYYDVTRTMGARQSFLVLKVAIPAAMPSVFVGLFMGLGASFSVLVVAEMMGVQAGLGWYLQWAQGWAAYGNMDAALLVMAPMCSGLITLLFRLRDRLLSWQKGLVQW